MPNLAELKSQLLDDDKITDREVEIIKGHIERDGKLDLDDVKFLVQLLSEAKEVCPTFDELFFSTLRAVILEDGRITQDEQFYLLKMLYSEGQLRDSEREFLVDLRSELKETTPEFEQLCEVAQLAPVTDWCVGGKS